jgi:hypothetical protein
MSDRIFGSATIVLSLLMMWATGLIEESFIQDPLGPKAFPALCSPPPWPPPFWSGAWVARCDSR